LVHYPFFIWKDIARDRTVISLKFYFISTEISSSSSSSPYPTKWGRPNMFSSSILFYHSSSCSLFLFSCHPSYEQKYINKKIVACKRHPSVRPDGAVFEWLQRSNCIKHNKGEIVASNSYDHNLGRSFTPHPRIELVIASATFVRTFVLFYSDLMSSLKSFRILSNLIIYVIEAIIECFLYYDKS
jgi:hypothetical protein